MNATVATEYTRSKIHPKKFALGVACASILMMFAAFTSAYIVRQAAGNWLEFRLPDIFYINTLVILLSSATVHGSYLAFKRGKTQAYRVLLVFTLILGLAFLALQYQGWQTLTAIGVELTTNPSGSFVYVISGVHAAHILGGIAALIVAIIHAFALTHKVTPARKLRFEMTLIYWHFVDFLWVYLLVFFTLQQS
ncbi:cytochrome c oxidase subunit 3 [Phaeodactylibacter xiamenensis]|jgi:cytochrome c oxidase subunit 3|uniref:Cytochrome oxidase subunit III n=1 Tax=Phaeodactylibacter xiamenensis TaxID=1524460 RepID=A0A098SDQ9_9BACT|nr:cytochrome c oxidase subunit 3 [Phaeodactylibacter xiamenensis]KGE89773.1 cytochrome oxidase subunit III [Phaeodactylibacter xiamenensis]MCR9054046.1 cytochrome c oxidase subunit 3 [bacterium]